MLLLLLGEVMVMNEDRQILFAEKMGSRVVIQALGQEKPYLPREVILLSKLKPVDQFEKIQRLGVVLFNANNEALIPH